MIYGRALDFPLWLSQDGTANAISEITRFKLYNFQAGRNTLNLDIYDGNNNMKKLVLVSLPFCGRKSSKKTEREKEKMERCKKSFQLEI
jgi:hypothetical protein